MDPLLSAEHLRFREEVRALLHRPPVAEELEEIRARPHVDLHADGVYRLLGEHRALAPDWPRRFGGRSAPASFTAIVQEELVARGVPDTIFVNTIKNAGALLLFAADDEQQARQLPALARGEASMAILYTEADAGSDLASLRTRAARVPEGWRITGTKRYSVKTAHAEHAVVAARTGEDGRPEAGITLFLVHLHDQRVRLRRLDTVNVEPFYEVDLDGMIVADDAVLGPVGGGWLVLSAGLAIERTGIDYNAKARHWLAVAADLLAGVPNEPVLTDRLVDLRTRAAAGRLLAWHLLERLDEDDLSAEQAAASKWFNAELGVHAARLCLDVDNALAIPTQSHAVMTALREAPGLTLSGGTSEVMLRLIADGLGLGARS